MKLFRAGIRPNEVEQEQCGLDDEGLLAGCRYRDWSVFIRTSNKVPEGDDSSHLSFHNSIIFSTDSDAEVHVQLEPARWCLHYRRVKRKPTFSTAIDYLHAMPASEWSAVKC